jgi:hypothetical protein
MQPNIDELLKNAQPTEKGTTERPSRLTCIVQAHHEQADDQPQSQRLVFQQIVDDGDSWSRRFSFNNKGQKLSEHCWVPFPGMVLVQSLSGPCVLIANSLDEADDQITVRQKSFALFEPANLDVFNSLVLKTHGVANKATVRVTVFPREQYD